MGRITSLDFIPPPYMHKDSRLGGTPTYNQCSVKPSLSCWPFSQPGFVRFEDKSTGSKGCTSASMRQMDEAVENSSDSSACDDLIVGVGLQNGEVDLRLCM